MFFCIVSIHRMKTIYIFEGNVQVVELLLKNGARVDTRAFWGATPLLVAVKNGNSIH